MTTNLALEAVETTPHISELCNFRTWDKATGIYTTQTGFGIAMEIIPIVGIAKTDFTALESLLTESNLSEMSIQVLNWASAEIAPAVDRWKQARKEKSLNDPRAAVLAQACRGEKFSGWRPRHYSAYIFIHMDSKKAPTVKDEQELGRIFERTTETFSGLGTHCRRLEPQHILKLFNDIFTPGADPLETKNMEWFEDDYLNEQSIGAGVSMDVSFKKIAFGGDAKGIAKCFTVKQMPEFWPPGASATLIGDVFREASFCPFPVLQSFTFRQTSVSGEVLGVKAGRAERAAKSAFRFLSPHAVAEVRDFGDVSETIADGQIMVSCHYQMVLFAEEKTMSEAESRLRNLFERRGFICFADDGLHLPTLKSALPFGGTSTSLKSMRRFNRTRTIKLSNAIALLPIFGEWQGNDRNSPALMLLAGRRGELAGWTPFESDANYNVCIIGQSGQGKSVAMQEIMAALVSIGGAAIVIDDGYSFVNSAAIMGGSHVDFGDDELFLNPFHAIDAKAMKDDDDFASTAISMLVNFIIALCHPGKEGTDIERALLTNVIQTCWKSKKNKATIDDVVTELKAEGKATDGSNKKDCDDLITLLRPFAAKGVYGKIFAHGCSVKMDAELMVFEMSHLRDKPAIQAACMTLLIFLSTQLMYHSPRDKPVGIMVDEAWALLSGSSADFIEGIARRARKYNGCLITATQGVGDYFRSKAAEAAWANSSWRLFFHMQDASIEALKGEKKVNCDEVLEQGLRSLNSRHNVWSEMIIHGQNGWDIGRLILDDVSLNTFSSDSKDAAFVTKMVAGGATRAEAVKALVEKKSGGGAS